MPGRRHPSRPSSRASAALPASARFSPTPFKVPIVKSLLVGIFVAAGLIAGGASAQTGPIRSPRSRPPRRSTSRFSGDSLPFSFVGPNNEPAGYSIDICKRVIAQIGRAVGEPNLKVNWMAGPVSERLQMVASGKADLECANTTQTLSRLANVDFSNLIFVDGGGFLVKSDSPINKTGRHGRQEDRRAQAARRPRQRLKDTLCSAVWSTRPSSPIADANEGVAMLESGSVDAYAGDKIKLVGLAAQAQGTGQARAAGRGSFVRAVRLRDAAQRFRVPARSQQGADAGLHGRRDRADLRGSGSASSAARRACSRRCTFCIRSRTDREPIAARCCHCHACTWQEIAT